MFSSVHLSYSNDESSTLGKARTSLLSLCCSIGRSQIDVTKENLTWEVFIINWLLCYFSVSNERVKKFVWWHKYVTGTQELLLLSIIRGSQLPLWASPLLGAWDSFLTVSLFCMFDQAFFFSVHPSNVSERWHRAALSHWNVQRRSSVSQMWPQLFLLCALSAPLDASRLWESFKTACW